MDLSPAVKRWGIVGAAVLLLVVVSWLLTGQVESRTDLVKPKTAFEGIIAPGDTRQTSLEGVAARLEDALARLERIEKRERDRTRAERETQGERLARLREELLTADERTRAELRQEIRRIEAAKAGAEAPASQGSNDAEPARTGPIDDGPGREERPGPEPAITAEPAIYTARPLDRPAEPETAEDLAERVFSLQPAMPAIAGEGSSRGAARAATAPGAIRTIRSEAVAGPGGRRAGGQEVQLPAGAILTGVLLNGLDAPAGSQSSREPLPVLVRLKHDAILPNAFTANVAECFVLLAVHGELSAERAMMRGEELSCIMTDGTVVQEKLAAYAVGEDGKTGVRGRVVSKQGAFLGNALIVGALKAASDAVSQTTEIAVGVGSGGTAAASGLTGAVSTGSGDALDRIAEWYLARADELFPVIEIDPGRRIDLVLTTGMTFRLEL